MPADKLAPQKRYIEKTIRRFVLNLNRNTDADLIHHLESIPNVQGYLKQLIRDDMRKGVEP